MTANGIGDGSSGALALDRLQDQPLDHGRPARMSNGKQDRRQASGLAADGHIYPIDPAHPARFLAGAKCTCCARWSEAPLPEDDEIAAAHPLRSGRHDLYAEAMRLVGARRSKAGLVELVTWLLLRAERQSKGCAPSRAPEPEAATGFTSRTRQEGNER